MKALQLVGASVIAACVILVGVHAATAGQADTPEFQSASSAHCISATTTSAPTKAAGQGEVTMSVVVERGTFIRLDASGSIYEVATNTLCPPVASDATWVETNGAPPVPATTAQLEELSSCDRSGDWAPGRWHRC